VGRSRLRWSWEGRRTGTIADKIKLQLRKRKLNDKQFPNEGRERKDTPQMAPKAEKNSKLGETGDFCHWGLGEGGGEKQATGKVFKKRKSRGKHMGRPDTEFEEKKRPSISTRGSEKTRDRPSREEA